MSFPLSDEERNEFRISISSKPLAGLKTLFNQLSADKDSELVSDNSRAKAAAKAKMVAWEIEIRKNGGASG